MVLEALSSHARKDGTIGSTIADRDIQMDWIKEILSDVRDVLDQRVGIGLPLVCLVAVLVLGLGLYWHFIESNETQKNLFDEAMSALRTRQ